jgi:DNA-binding NtrC family response regulator
MTRILVVDDDRGLRMAIRKAFRRKGIEVHEAYDGVGAVGFLKSGACPDGPIDGCILDLKMPHLDGLEVLRRTPTRQVPVVVLTGHGSVTDAVAAMRLGASDFVQKPVDADELWAILSQSLSDTHRPAEEILIFESPTMSTFIDRLERSAATDEPVLLMGETGVGKRLAARWLHDRSPRKAGPFVVCHAAAPSPEHGAAALVGHAKGSLGNSDEERVGLLSQAAAGTLFINEVADLSAEAQSILLGALEDGAFMPMGSNASEDVRTRIVAATTRDLPELVETGRFSAELYYRLGVLPLVVPPLRQRKKDVIKIAESWLARLAPPGRPPISLTERAGQLLVDHPFPGNVRELINVIKRAVIFCDDGVLETESIRELLDVSPFPGRPASGLMRMPETYIETASLAERGGNGQARTARRSPGGAGPGVGDKVTLADLEKAHIERLLMETENVSEVARIVGIDRRTLQRKIAAWGLKRPS